MDNFDIVVDIYENVRSFVSSGDLNSTKNVSPATTTVIHVTLITPHAHAQQGVM